MLFKSDVGTGVVFNFLRKSREVSDKSEVVGTLPGDVREVLGLRDTAVVKHVYCCKLMSTIERWKGKQEAAEDILGGSTKLLTFVRLWVALILADCLK